MYPPRIDTRCQLPTPEQIAERTAEIRNGWTDRETYRRAGVSVQPVETWVVDIPGCERAGANL